MSIIPKVPLFTLKIRPAELVILSVYLADRSRKEKSSYLRKFLAYVTRIVIEEALNKAFSKTRLEHECPEIGTVKIPYEESEDEWQFIVTHFCENLTQAVIEKRIAQCVERLQAAKTGVSYT